MFTCFNAKSTITHLGNSCTYVGKRVFKVISERLKNVRNFRLVSILCLCAVFTAAVLAFNFVYASAISGSTDKTQYLNADVSTNPLVYDDTSYVLRSIAFNTVSAEVELQADLIASVREDYISECEETPYETEYLYSSTMFEDESIVIFKGQPGYVRMEYKNSYENDELLSRELLNTVTISEPVTEYVRIGTRERLSTGNYALPVGGYITSYFGYRNVSVGSTYHQGIDISNSFGTPILASDGGKIIFAESYDDFGNLVKIEHDNGDITFYAHLDAFTVSVGDTVKQGDQVGTMGLTGITTGEHLHFEYHPGGGNAIDPLEVLILDDTIVFYC